MSFRSWISPIHEWQQHKLADAPKVYLVVDRNDEFENAYESREAAELEVQWLQGIGIKCRVRVVAVHSMELSRERWS